MSDTEKTVCIVIAVLLVLFIGLGSFFGLTHAGRAIWNLWFGSVQKVDDATNYQTLKKVEDTCRAMIASYEADKLTWGLYKGSDSQEKQGWAEQAKMRANKTAATYNNYILENSCVWSGNVPNDIKNTLPYLE